VRRRDDRRPHRGRIGRSTRSTRWVPLAAVVVLSVAVTACGGGTASPQAATTSVPGAPDTATSAPSSAAAGSQPSSDPCALADPVDAQAVLGPLAGAPLAKSAMSGDSRGLVLNCVFSAAADPAKVVDYTQRLNFGRALFEQSRDVSAATNVITGTDAYWMPSGPGLLVLDGEDLVAITFRNVPVDQARAQAMMDHALRLRHASSSPTTAPR